MGALLQLAGMSIRTTYEPLNFTPVRSFDWTAIDDGTYDGAEDSDTCTQIGRGATEAEAIAELIIEVGRFHDASERDAAWRYRLARLMEG